VDEARRLHGRGVKPATIARQVGTEVAQVYAWIYGQEHRLAQRGKSKRGKSKRPTRKARARKS
jgi:hypothetical protein